MKSQSYAQKRYVGIYRQDRVWKRYLPSFMSMNSAKETTLLVYMMEDLQRQYGHHEILLWIQNSTVVVIIIPGYNNIQNPTFWDNLQLATLLQREQPCRPCVFLANTGTHYLINYACRYHASDSVTKRKKGEKGTLHVTLPTGTCHILLTRSTLFRSLRRQMFWLHTRGINIAKNIFFKCNTAHR
jgi:hypothetical protein